MNKEKKNSRYSRLYTQISDLVKEIKNPLSVMATINAVLHHKMDYFYWTGFYLLSPEGELLVGPYQGPLACLRLKKDTGVCWASINRAETVIVDDVHEFPGHIACSEASKSEIVVPVFENGQIRGCLDVDSKSLSSFDEVDRDWLVKISGLVYR